MFVLDERRFGTEKHGFSVPSLPARESPVWVKVRYGKPGVSRTDPVSAMDWFGKAGVSRTERSR